MIQKYIYGDPIETDAVIKEIPVSKGNPSYGTISTQEGFSFTYIMQPEDIVYGLGEANRGINKRGFLYISNCTDEAVHTEDKLSLYGAHNFIIVDGINQSFGLFVDYPTNLTFDIGYTRQDTLSITCADADLKLYVIDGSDAYDITRQFRRIIGRSYIPPRFAFGFGQSRWGYEKPEDFRKVVSEHRAAHVPLDMVYMDIDYMDHYKDFTVNTEAFPDFKGFVDEMKDDHVHLVPIIDAGVKIEEGYDTYEEGLAGDYFCKREDGSNFEAAVWPGLTHFPDVLNKDARKWFGEKYDFLLSQGIDAFWNDMNEPAIFYTPESMEETQALAKSVLSGESEYPPAALPYIFRMSHNIEKDYANIYHNMDGKKICHTKVHNLFGYNMTRAASEAFTRLVPDRRILLFSRSSYIGMHRYGGIWTGDNKSWWNHILLCLKMLPGLNMCGFLYSGCDLGGFGENTTRDLVLRFLGLGVFTPLMRNHSATRTREQEFYQFEDPQDFAAVIGVRYRLLPYLYSEFMKAALNDDLYFKPLAFTYPKDVVARRIEDQLMLGNEIMIAPVYTQNATGRPVYLPEEMIFVKFLADGTIYQETMEKGWHYVDVALNEVPLFIRKDHKIPVVDVAEYVDAIDMDTLQYIGFEDADYELYTDDGTTPIA